MILAEAASAHPDNTYSMLRGGIDRYSRQQGQPPIVNSGAIIVRINGDRNEVGQHVMTVVLQNEQGQTQPPAFPQINFTVAPGGGTYIAVLNLTGLPLPPTGIYFFRVLVDGNEVTSWRLEVL
jgi:hypothetical protein